MKLGEAECDLVPEIEHEELTTKTRSSGVDFLGRPPEPSTIPHGIQVGEEVVTLHGINSTILDAPGELKIIVTRVGAWTANQFNLEKISDLTPYEARLTLDQNRRQTLG